MDLLITRLWRDDRRFGDHHFGAQNSSINFFARVFLHSCRLEHLIFIGNFEIDLRSDPATKDILESQE